MIKHIFFLFAVVSDVIEDEVWYYVVKHSN